MNKHLDVIVKQAVVVPLSGILLFFNAAPCVLKSNLNSVAIALVSAK